MLVTLIILAWFGLALGSFVNAVVWRIHEQTKTKKKSLSILHGRSMCPNCRHELAVADLIPVLSWLMLRGRCRYCHRPVSAQYPLVELAGGLTFAASYYFWPGGINTTGDWTLFITWLLVAVGLLALLVYDFRWMILPNRIIYPAFFVALAGRLAYILLYSGHTAHSFWLLAMSVAVASGLFWLLFMVSKGAWIGYGDVRLGLITGTVLADPALSTLMIFLSSILGCLFILPALLTGRKRLASKLPYGPFLIMATAISLLFGQSIINWYKGFLGF